MILASEEGLCETHFDNRLACFLFATVHFHLLDAFQLWTSALHTAPVSP